MSTATMTTADVKLRDAVLVQLDWDPAVDASGIGVAAKDGTITLTGYIDTYAGKLAAERAAKAILGVRAVANEIEVTSGIGRTDSEMADDVVVALRRESRAPESVQATVQHARVTLTGRVDWLFQKLAAERAVGHIRGVRHVTNYIEIAPHAVERDVRQRIVKALHQNASVDAEQIHIDLTGHRVTLTGTTGSLFQRDAAEWAAAQTPGVAEVENRIAVVNREIPDVHADEPY